MTIEVRPIYKKRWHGKEGEDSIQRPIKLEADVDRTSMKYNTGLSYVGRYDHKDNKEGLTEAEFYGKLLKQDLHDVFDRETPHPFWNSPMGTVKLDNKPIFLHTDRPLDYVRWKMLKASKYVANSKKDYDEGLYPEATHIIYDEREGMEEKATRAELKYKLGAKLLEMSPEAKMQLATALTGRTCRKQSSNYITSILDDQLEKNTNELARFINMDKKDFSTYTLVMEALHMNILRKVKYQIFFQDSVIGNDVMDVVEYLKKDENQELKVRIMASIN